MVEATVNGTRTLFYHDGGGYTKDGFSSYLYTSYILLQKRENPSINWYLKFRCRQERMVIKNIHFLYVPLMTLQKMNGMIASLITEEDLIA